MSAGGRDSVEAARKRLGVDVDLARCIVRIGFSIENTTKAEVDAMYRAALDGSAAAGKGSEGGSSPGDEGEERQADRRKARPK